MPTCNCPKCGAKHPKRKTPPTTERDIDIINLMLDGNSKAQIAEKVNLTYDRVRQITNSAQMSVITDQLDTGITKLQELKNRVARYKRIEQAVNNYIDIRENPESNEQQEYHAYQMIQKSLEQ